MRWASAHLSASHSAAQTDVLVGQNAHFVAVGQLIAKAAWNYFLLEGDGSEGVQNPSFYLDVISASVDALLVSIAEFEEVEE